MTLALHPSRWLSDFGRSPRILGLDIARGVAILGMVGAHIGETERFRWLDPSTWTGLVHGRSSILFALLAGVSIALLTGRTEIPERAALPGIRLRLIGRGAAIFIVGLGLEMLNTPVAVILTLYGVLYVTVIPFLRWRARRLLIAAAVLAVAGPAVLVLLGTLTLHPFGAGIGLVISGSYPITVWMVFVLGGLALGRMRLETVRWARLALVVGVLLVGVGYGLGAVGRAVGPPSPATPGVESSGESGWAGYISALGASNLQGALFSGVFSVEPHSGATAEIIGSGGFALAVIGLCLLVSRFLRWPLLPVGALGSMPLSAYSAHLLSIFVIAGPGGQQTGSVFWAVTALALLVGSTCWSMFLGRGPLESLVSRAADAMATVPPLETR